MYTLVIELGLCFGISVRVTGYRGTRMAFRFTYGLSIYSPVHRRPCTDAADNQLSGWWWQAGHRILYYNFLILSYPILSHTPSPPPPSPRSAVILCTGTKSHTPSQFDWHYIFVGHHQSIPSHSPLIQLGDRPIHLFRRLFMSWRDLCNWSLNAGHMIRTWWTLSARLTTMMPESIKLGVQIESQSHVDPSNDQPSVTGGNHVDFLIWCNYRAHVRGRVPTLLLSVMAPFV